MPSALLIAEYGSLNGGENSLLAILPDLIRRGWKFSALVPESGDFSKALADCQVQVTPFRFLTDGRRKPLEQLRAELGVAIRRLAPDLVHCNSLSTSRIVGPVCREMAIPSVGYLRDILKPGRQAIMDLNCVDRIVAVSQATRRWHVAQGIDENRIVTIHNGIDPLDWADGPDSGQLRDELNIPSSSPIVLFVGQIGLRKGLDTWMTTAAEVRDKLDSVHFVLAGQRHSTKRESIDYEQQLLAQSMSDTLKGHVHWLGTRKDIAEIMQASTVLLHCARQEPLGRVLLEAYSIGLPAVATNVGGTAEIFLGPLPSRFLIPVDDPSAAASAVLELLQSREMQVSLSGAQREVARKSFSIENCSEKLSAVYDDLIGTNSGRICQSF